MGFDSDRYTRLLLEALGLKPLGPGADPRSWTLRALFQPTFHRDCCLTLTSDGPGALLEWIVLTQESRCALLHQMGLRGFASPQGAPRAPQVALQEVVEVAERDLARCLQRVALVDPYAQGPGDRFGIDGMPVCCETQRGAQVRRFDTWSPSPQRHPAHHQYLLTLLDLARAALRDPLSQEALDEVRGYL